MKNIAIKENHLYNKTFKRGKSYVGRLVAVYVLRDLASAKLARANPTHEYVNRVGLSVSKKLGGAVVRNRTKRIIRAAFDTCKPRLKKGFLIVISARGASVGKKSGDVAKELEIAFTSLGMFIPESRTSKDL